MDGNERSPSPEPDDRVLAARVARGDVAAFELIYDRYVNPVYALAAHVLGAAEAEEVVQDVFLRLWHKADQFDPERGAFGAWFMAITRHRVFEELRGRGRQQRVTIAADVEQLLVKAADDTVNVEEQALRSEGYDAALRALDGLPAEQRVVLILAYFGGLSQSAIAEHLDLPLGTVKKRTRLALQKLRHALSHHDAMVLDEGEPAEPARQSAWPKS